MTGKEVELFDKLLDLKSEKKRQNEVFDKLLDWKRDKEKSGDKAVELLRQFVDAVNEWENGPLSDDLLSVWTASHRFLATMETGETS